MQLLFGDVMLRLIAYTQDLHIPRGWVILVLAALAWGIVFLGWMGLSALF